MINTDMSVCVCGGGNIGHSLVAAFGRYGDITVLTRHPERWSSNLNYQIANDSWMKTNGKVSATSTSSIVGSASIVVIALPRFAINQELSKIEPYLHEGQTLVFVPAPSGMEYIVDRLNSRGIDVIGYQRVPFISRIKEYGKSVTMGAVRPISKVAISNQSNRYSVLNYLENCIGSKIELLSSFLSFTFSNSNPLLHPARLVELLHKDFYDTCPHFYAEWGDEASELYIEADKEMKEIFLAYDSKSAMNDYESVLEHYCVESVAGLTKKIRSIESFKTILSPYKQNTDGLWRPDFDSRYFTEDIPYGTMEILNKAISIGIEPLTIRYLVTEVMKYIPT